MTDEYKGPAVLRPDLLWEQDKQSVRDMSAAIEQHGGRRCDAAACNCGAYHWPACEARNARLREAEGLLARCVALLRPMLGGEIGCITAILSQHETVAECEAYLADSRINEVEK